MYRRAGRAAVHGAQFLSPFFRGSRAGWYRHQALLGGRRRPADARVSRRGVGCAAPRRPGPVRQARARWLPGRALLARHLAQARPFPRGVRPVQPRAYGPLRSQEDRAASERSGDRPQPSESECRDRQRPAIPPLLAKQRLVLRLSLGLRGGEAEAIPSAHAAGSPRPLSRVGRDERGARRAWLPLFRADHLLCLHAGGGDGERPPRHLLPSPRGAAPRSVIPASPLTRPIGPPRARSAEAVAPWSPARTRTRT